MKRLTKIVLLVFLAFLLVLIRLFEDSLFYDPLTHFFKIEHSSNTLPPFNSLQLLGNIVLRFLMNTLLSLLILWVVFRDSGIIKFSGLIYSALFVLLFASFCFLLFYSETDNFLPLFYVRRFLIQPLFLLILLPAFYFQKRK